MLTLSSCVLRRARRISILIFSNFIVISLLSLWASAQTAHAGGILNLIDGAWSAPFGVAVDTTGNVYVSDFDNNAVKEIPLGCASIGCVNTLGSGFHDPRGVAVDGAGNIYVADYGNNAVKQIFASGGYQTVNTLGSGFSSPTGAAVDGLGNIYVADYGNNAVKQILASGGYQTVNTLGSGFSSPTGVAVDGLGNIYVADYGNNAVKQILASGGYQTVNTLGSGFSSPAGVAVDGLGNIYVADYGNNAVKQILASGGYQTVNTLASRFYNLSGVAVDGAGNVYFADFNSAVKQIIRGAAMKFPTTAVGSTSATFSIPFTFDSGGQIGAPVVLTQGATNLDFVDVGTGTCTTNGTSYTYSAGDQCTVDVTFTPKYPGQRMGAVQLTTSGAVVIATNLIYGTGTGSAVTFPHANAPVKALGSDLGFGGVAVDGAGNFYFADANQNVLRQIVAAGDYLTVKTLASGFSSPWGVAVDGAGDVYVADSYNNAVKQIVASSGYQTVKTLGSGFGHPMGVAVDGTGNVYVADSGNGAVKEIVASSGYQTVKTLHSGFSACTGVAVDGAGNVYVAEYAGNNSVLQIVASSSYQTVKTLASGFRGPMGLAVDGAGNVYVAEMWGNAVKQILASGGYQTVNTLGSGFKNPSGVAVDGAGNVYVADWSNMKEIDLADGPALTFASTRAGGNLPSSDSPQTVTLANIGNAALTFPVPTTGNNPFIDSNNFILVDAGSTSCPLVSSGSSSPGTLAAGESCTFAVSFLPQEAGSISSSLILTDTNLNAAAPSYAMQSISLNGTGIPADLTSTGVSASPNPVTINQSVTFTATVSDTTNSGRVPTGYIKFIDTFGGTATFLNRGAAVLLSKGSASLSVILSGVGQHTIIAYYEGDPGLWLSSDSSTTVTVSGQSQTVTFPNPGTQTYGVGPLTLNASATSGLPVSYSVTAGPATVNGNMLTITGAGTVAVQATQAGDSTNWQAATPVSITFSVSPASLTIVLGNLTQTYDGQPRPVSVTAPASYLLTYTGIAPTNYSQSANPPSDPGSYTVVATVTDPNYVGGATGTLVINQLAPNLNFALLTGMPEPSIYGSTVYYALSVAQTPCPTGQVQFYLDGQVVSTLTLAGTSCTQPVYFQTTTLTPRQHSVYAVYSGDTYYQGQTSGTVSHTVDANGTSVTLATSSNTVNVGQLAKFTATVSPTTPNGGTQAPNGTVQFFDSGAPIGSGTLSTTSPYAASFSTTSLAAGSHSITATYSNADGLYTGSSSAVVVETVDKIVPVITWTPSATRFTYGTKLTSDMLNATAASGGNTVDGTFTYDVSVGDVLPVGTRNVVATFKPTDTTTYASQSATMTFTVQAAKLTVTADNQSRGYGAANPTLSYQITGLVNGDAQSVVSGTPNLTTTAAANSRAGSYPITVDVSGLTASNYTFTAANGDLNVTQAVLTVVADDRPMSYGTSVPTLTGTLMGVISGDGITATYSTTATSASAPGTYWITPKLNDPNNKLGNYAVSSTNGTLTVNKAASNATIQTNASDVLAKTNVTLTARVSSTTSGTPTGTVAFMDGTTSLGSATLDNSGTATLTINTLIVGNHSLTAAYGGDTDFTGVSSAAIMETVQDFQFVINGGSTGSPVMTEIVKAGGIATYQFQMSPTGGTTFPSAVTLTLTGLPAGATYTITPASIAADSGAQTVTIQVQTSKHTAALRQTHPGAPLFALGMLFPLLGMVRLRRAVRNPRKRAALLLLLMLVLGILGLSACGGGNGSANGQLQTHTMQLTGSSGAIQHTATLVLTVQ